MEARFLQTELERKTGRRVFIDSDHLRNLENLQEHVAPAQYFMAKQSGFINCAACAYKWIWQGRVTCFSCAKRSKIRLGSSCSTT